MRNRSLRHLALSVALSIALLTTALVASPWQMTGGDTLRDIYEAQSKQVAAEALGLASDGHNHRHDDPATKNSITRAGESEGTADPTTAAAARRNTAYAASQRKLRDPKLTTAPLRTARRTIPESRYAVAGGCYRLGNTATRFQASDLGVHLLYSPQRTFLTAAANNTATWAAAPSTNAEWSTRRTSQGFAFQTGGNTWLRYADGAFSTGAEPSYFALRTTTGCAVYPEVETDVTGNPHAGVSDFQEVRGYVDPHVHGMSYEFLGGEVHCGRPWHKYGAPYALPDCSDTSQQGTKGGVLDLALSGGASRDPVGWPTFKGWPKPDALTHEGVYYKWLERSWRGGQRIMVNLLVENGQLCNLYPAKRNSCNDMDSARLQAKRMRQLERYIDAQYGGPGKGWYRIVTDPFEARKVINQGKLAIIMGVEVSIPFGCTMKLDIAACDVKQITNGLNELYDLGVRQMELVNKFDNALSGVAGDEGGIGPLVNLANFLETGSFWSMTACDPKAGDSTDKTQLGVPDLTGGQAQDALFGAVAQLGLSLPALPIYPSGRHCNRRGLTDLGENVLEQMVAKNMLIDPDHMSVKARTATLDLLEGEDYSGVVSSHSWSTPDAYPRIYNMGGFVAPMAGDSSGFVEKWKRHLTWANKRYYFGFGSGADINGLAQQAMPRGANVKNKVTYPVTGLGGVRIDRQRSGERIFDINADGVAHYGLYPDWMADLTKVSGSTAINQDMARGAEAFLQTWERAHGVRADSCRNPELRKPVNKVRKLLKRGMTTNAVMAAVGQPYERLGTSYTFCAKKPVRNRAGKVVRWKKVTATATFSKGGKLRALHS